MNGRDDMKEQNKIQIMTMIGEVCYLPVIEHKQLSLYVNEELRTFFLRDPYTEIHIFHIQDVLYYQLKEEREVIVADDGTETEYCKRLTLSIRIREQGEKTISYEMVPRKIQISSIAYRKLCLLAKQYEFFFSRLLISKGIC